ncbi:MAG: hypothetical protein LUG86_01255 [Oscillospiraceae bacterium]|nr:hypothetical protein [Oscillospiraceae bacterium]
MRSYETPMMDIILFEGEAWSDVVTSTTQIDPSKSKLAQAIEEAEAAFAAYQ